MVQGNCTVEEYEIKFIELVKHVSYMDIDQCQEYHFIYRLNPKIREMVWMWKPSSIAKVVEQAHYAKERLDLKEGNKTIFHNSQGLCRRPLVPFAGGISRPPP